VFNLLKRFSFFIILNIVFIATVSLIIYFFGLNRYMTANGIDYETLAFFCLVWGFTGAFFSLFLSKFIAKKTMGVILYDENHKIYRMVDELSKRAGIKTPEVGYYYSMDINAFATGWSKNNSLVAVSMGLVHQMNEDEIKGVLGHEIAHISNGDMVTMTLVQGLVNSFVMFFARVLAKVVTSIILKDKDGKSDFINFLLVFCFEICLGLLGLMITSYYSRVREFKADKEGARLAGRRQMIMALEALKKDNFISDSMSSEKMAAFKINSKSKLMKLFSTHPDLDCRIKKLKSCE